MSKGPTTKVSNAKLKHLIKLAETFCIKAENGEWKVQSGTYQAILKATDHVKTEMAKQDRQRRRTMDISYVQDPERREAVSRSNTQKIEGIERFVD
jgi:hypothetical protein